MKFCKKFGHRLAQSGPTPRPPATRFGVPESYTPKHLAEKILTMKSGRIKYRTMKGSDVTVRTYGCLAVISGTAEFGVTFGGQDRTVPLRFHSIWAKRPDGAIQFVSGQATGIPAKQ